VLPNLPINLKRLRLARGLTQAELGARIGRPQQYLSQLERGLCLRDPDDLTRLAMALDVPVARLLHRWRQPAWLTAPREAPETVGTGAMTGCEARHA